MWSKEKVEDCFGKTDIGSKTIIIYKHDSLEIERETLFHELLHAALDDKIDAIFCFDNDRKIDDKEENLVRLLSPSLMQILSGNPKLQNYLFGRKHERRS